MDMVDKFELCEAYRAIELMASVDGDVELMGKLSDLEFGEILNMERQYHFFKNLHMQTELDNVLSLMKIFKKLNVDMPNIKINLSDLQSTYDELWDSINSQITISNEQYLKLMGMIFDIVENDHINHPNTKRRLNNVLNHLRIRGREYVWIEDELYVHV